MGDSAKYQYDRGFQERIVALVLREPAFVHDYEDVVDPAYFEAESLGIISRLALEFFRKTNEIPNRDTLRETLKDYCQEYRVGERVLGEVETDIDTVYKIDLSNVQAVRDRVIRFGQRQALRSAVLEIADLVQKDDEYDRAREIIGRALHVGTGARELGVHLGTDLLRLPQMAAESTYAVANKVPTYWPTFDKYTSGGMGRKEVWIFAALSGIGKSTCLVQLGVSALTAGHAVLHYTVGDLDEVDVELRYASRMTGCTIPEIITNDPKFQARATARAKYNTNLWVKHYSSGQATMGQVRSHISKLVHVKNFHPGVIIFDYPDEMKIGEDLYRDLGQIYGDFQAICHDYNSLGIAASQVDRFAPKRENEIIRMEHVDHSKLKYAKCDGFVSINQTIAERKAGKARLWVDKTRRWGSHYLIELDVDYAQSRMTEAREVQYEEPEPPLPPQSGRKQRGR